MTNSSIIFVEVKIFWESILFYAEISANINWHILLLSYLAIRTGKFLSFCPYIRCPYSQIRQYILIFPIILTFYGI